MEEDKSYKFCYLCKKWFNNEELFKEHLEYSPKHKKNDNIILNSNVKPGLKRGPKGGKLYITEKNIRNSIEEAGNLRNASKILEISYPTMLKYTRIYYNIENYKELISKIRKSLNKVKKGKKYSTELKYTSKINIIDIISGKRKISESTYLYKLINEEYKLPLCENCGFNTIRQIDKKIPLKIKYKDFNKNNKNVENIIILCYNCNYILSDLLNYNLINKNKENKIIINNTENKTNFSNIITNEELIQEFVT